MDSVHDNEAGGFAFVWSIHNFSYCVQQESESLRSPYFAVESIKDKSWYLELYPRGNDAPGFISLYLQRPYMASNVKFVLSVQVSNGLFEKIGEPTIETDKGKKTYQHQQGYRFFLSLKKLKGPDSYRNKDNLTLRCRMWTKDTDL